VARHLRNDREYLEPTASATAPRGTSSLADDAAGTAARWRRRPYLSVSHFADNDGAVALGGQEATDALSLKWHSLTREVSFQSPGQGPGREMIVVGDLLVR
jgi:hypothetical protein